jgi:hypothetical protein
MFKAALLGLGATILLVGPSTAARTDQKSDDIQTLLRLTHRTTDDLIRVNNKMIEVALKSFKVRSPNMTNAQDAQMEAATRDFVKNYIAELENQISSYYYTHTSDDEIKGTIAFLQSPDGQSYLSTSRELRQEMSDTERKELPGKIRGLIQTFKSILWPGATLPPGSKSL